MLHCIYFHVVSKSKTMIDKNSNSNIIKYGSIATADNLKEPGNDYKLLIIIEVIKFTRLFDTVQTVY